MNTEAAAPLTPVRAQSTVPEGAARAMPISDTGLRLLGYSFLVLFFELALIRYIPAHVRATSYFINLILIAAFLGLGVGLLLHRRVPARGYLFGLALLVLVLVCKYFENVLVTIPAGSAEEFWAIYYDFSDSSRSWGLVPVVCTVFAVTAVTFAPLGLLIGEVFARFRPLVAYSIDILGSLLGLAAFAGLSLLSTAPVIWFALGGAVYVLLLRGAVPRALGGVTMLAVVWVVQGMSSPGGELWSPYYRINFFKLDQDVVVNVNGSLHQYAIDFSPQKLADGSSRAAIRSDYLRPYQLFEGSGGPGRVLILGSGTGNDIVMALSQGAKEIDAVEIDPMILELGRAIHPQRPYDAPNVSVTVDDARAFLKRTDRRYDLIVLGTLDSQTLLSGLSSVRLDNYVYTREAFESVRDHLAPGGKLILYHMSPLPYVGYKIYHGLAEAFGQPPLVHFEYPHRLFNYTFVAGVAPGEALPGFSREMPGPGPAVETGEGGRYPVATDAWPYLYITHPTIPAHYLWAGGGIALFSLLVVGGALGRGRLRRPDGPLFFLGAGFLLLETKSVTEMSLLFGSTWQVNVLVFGAVLLIILAANFTAMRFPGISRRAVYALLVVSTLIAYLLPARELLGLPLTLQWLAGGLMVAVPIYFASIAFATTFRGRAEPVTALGYNLLGAILGGLAEYSSMALGTKSLYLVALLMYGLAFVLDRRRAVG